ncbi:hypothetical protein [Streptomyces sp. SPB162]|uniref:hypothetical protein n=1 Tax=Streptomyces sp. SPB162 TaxID=2940560 RepID=UPI002406D9FE|nr:hypothetical protein [Streptomyces sp. SPB162]
MYMLSKAASGTVARLCAGDTGDAVVDAVGAVDGVGPIDLMDLIGVVRVGRGVFTAPRAGGASFAAFRAVTRPTPVRTIVWKDA